MSDLVQRLRGRIGPLLHQHDNGIACTLEAADKIERLTAEGTDRWDAWWEMRDEFECSKGPFTSEQALEIMDSYETIGMAEYRKVRDSGSPKRECTYWWARDKGLSEYPYKEHWRDCEVCQGVDPDCTGIRTGTPADSSQERVAQLTAHRACGSEEHDPANGKIHGCCVVCLTPWPCPTAADSRQADKVRYEYEQGLDGPEHDPAEKGQ